jgi:hypothetical protein
MSIPLDRLYNYLHDIVNHDTVIYRWNPHGSKKLEDLSLLNPQSQHEVLGNPVMVFHDQEPLNFNYYTNQDIKNLLDIFQSRGHGYMNIPFELVNKVPSLRLATTAENLYDKMILVHSELQSDQVEIYKENGFIPVYYWSHYILARDWFRYAKHTQALDQHTPTQPFLIYNRAWSGSREYRLKFAELLVKSGLSTVCQMGFNSYDNGQTYHLHKFKNPALQISTTNLEDYFFKNNTPAAASADYNTQDYQKTNIEIILETLFDDTRLHLTEKSLRPIACGHPFILAATPGSLAYLRSYGFETFDGLIDETYDTIKDPVQRLQAIIQEMERLLTVDQTVWDQLRIIAARNKQRFFSADTQEQIINEYTKNVESALKLIQEHHTGQYWDLLTTMSQKYSPNIYNKFFANTVEWAKQKLKS